MPHPAPTDPRLKTHTAVRADIQALRAFAVLAVVLFHLWPLALPGGYVGVDVFFVISGFLITGQLVRARERGTLHLGRFWAARARRLLPLSLVVLLVSVVLTLIWAPETVVAQHLRSVIGSALYVENWLLAADGVDYLAHDNQPPIAQHYWSLAVEEQFYLLWPLLIILATIGAKATAARRRVLLFGAAVIAALSFAASIWLTANIYPFGYFSTVSRIWEFAIGAIVALMPALRLHRAVRTTFWLIAVGALLATSLLFGTATAFPGPWALVPVVATALVIAIGPSAPFTAAGWLLGLRPVQWIGDQSYGIYLWHWPLVVIAPAVLGRPTDLLENVLLLLMTIALAAITKRFVEDPIRFGRRPRAAGARMVGLTTVAAMLVVVASALIPIQQIDRAAAERSDAVAAELADPGFCRGAHLLLDDGCDPAEVGSVEAAELLPALAALRDDTGGAFACYDPAPEAGDDPASCTIGAESSAATRIALTGDSHAAMLIPGLSDVAESNGWSIDTYVGRGCVWQEPALDGCEARAEVLDPALLTRGYDAILVTAWNQPALDAAGRERVAAQYATAWEGAEEQGIEVIVLADNPMVPQSALDCVGTVEELALATCAVPLDETRFAEDPLRAAASSSGAELIDLSAAYCDQGICPMQLGGVQVYRDTHHITATFSRTLAPYLTDGIAAALNVSTQRR